MWSAPARRTWGVIARKRWQELLQCRQPLHPGRTYSVYIVFLFSLMVSISKNNMLVVCQLEQQVRLQSFVTCHPIIQCLLQGWKQPYNLNTGKGRQILLKMSPFKDITIYFFDSRLCITKMEDLGGNLEIPNLNKGTHLFWRKNKTIIEPRKKRRILEANC